MKYNSPLFENYSFDFARVNVILGANGSGKSKLLTEIKNQAGTLTGGAKVAYIEGGRTIKIKDILQLDHTNVGAYDRYDSAVTHYFNKRVTSLADRVFDALLVLDKRDALLKGKHSDAVDRWTAEGQKGECPRRAQPPLEHFFELFSEIFPLITLSYDPESRKLSAQKNGQSYGPSSLSDGEKQVFSILADLIELDDAHELIVADEPELNLHPELAERLWTLIENEFPGKTFIYATHSISFALRENVEQVWVLSADAKNITRFTGFDSLERPQVTAFLGALPGILSANRVLVTEGHEKSFDAIFYRWLLQDKKLEIYSCGGCSDVAAVIAKSGIWAEISSNVELRGVVDADFRDEKALAECEAANVHVLNLHEAESYLCFPEIICAIASRIGSQAVALTEDEVLRQIVERLAKDRLAIAAKRVFARSRVVLAVSVQRRLMAAVSDREELLKHMKEAAASQLEQAETVLGPEKMEALLDEELAVIDGVLAVPSAEAALRLLPAKSLLQSLAQRAGCKNGSEVMRSVQRNFMPGEFAITKHLAAALIGNMQGPVSAAVGVAP